MNKQRKYNFQFFRIFLDWTFDVYGQIQRPPEEAVFIPARDEPNEICTTVSVYVYTHLTSYVEHLPRNISSSTPNL